MKNYIVKHLRIMDHIDPKTKNSLKAFVGLVVNSDNPDDTFYLFYPIREGLPIMEFLEMLGNMVTMLKFKFGEEAQTKGDNL